MILMVDPVFEDLFSYWRQNRFGMKLNTLNIKFFVLK